MIPGKEAGKRGKVLRVVADEERVVVERVNFIKRHVKPIAEEPAGRGHRARGRHAHLERAAGLPELQRGRRGWACAREGDGKVRFCKKCNVQVDKG